jgi:signal transduction histidine kinase
MQLVENTLQFSRAQRPVVGLSPERMTLAPAVREIVATFEPLAEAAGSNIVTDLDETSSAVVDRSAFRQMLLNLLDNALKYGPREQTITVRLSPPQLQATNHCVRISIDDEGPGIFGRSRDEIWAPFVRGNGGDPQATGCGLGLAVVRELATRHSGRAWVESPPTGRGSRFVIELPAAGFTVESPSPAVA